MYVDSAVLVKLVVREPDSGFYADLLDGQRAVIASELSIPECRKRSGPRGEDYRSSRSAEASSKRQAT